MANFKKKLQFSASVVALMCGGGLLSGAARAVTVTGNQTSVFINTNVAADLVVAGTGVITPGGLLVDADIGAKLINNGSIKAVANATTAGVTTSAIGLQVNGTVGSDVVNTGTISATATSKVAASGAHDSHSNYADASATGLFVSSVTGDFSNSGTISAVASADLAYTAGSTKTAATTATVADVAYAYALGAELDTANGTIDNTSAGSIKASATATSEYNIIAKNGYVDASLSRASASATATGLHIQCHE